MKAVVLPQYNKNIIRAMLSLKVEEVEDIVPINNDDLVIKVHAASVNPSDIAFLQGGYNIVKTLPAIPGFEASGVVTDAGESVKYMIGKKVSCFVQEDSCGTWSEYVVAGINDIIVLKDEINMDQAACLAVNPVTAYGMFEIVKLREARAIIQNAAGGQVAGFIRAMAHDFGVDVIDVVRKQESIETVKKRGAKNVLATSDPEFVEKLKILCDELKPTVAFDAVGGELSGIMFNSLENDSELVVYGGLSNKSASGFDVMDLIFKNKIVSGFNLVDWKNEIEKDEFDAAAEAVQENIIDGIYKTEIISKVPLSGVVKGLRNYIGNMSAGKLLVKPD